MPKSPRFQPTAGRSIELLAFPAVQLLDVAGPLQVFGSANELASAAGESAPYFPRVVSRAGGVVNASVGLGLATDALSALDAPVDTLIVTGGKGVRDAASNAQVVEWVRGRAAHARRVASVCTGAFLLAEAGLLDGRRAATHWAHSAELARRFPAVCVEPDPIFVRDGQVWSSAGITAGIDLALALVQEDLGRAFAFAVARRLVVFLKRPGGQAQFSAALSLQTDEDYFGELHAWMNRHLGDNLSLARLARRAHMSERTFSRHYARATGLTPARAVERLRVDAARRFLSDTRLPVKRIAMRCGFGSEETLRRSFLRLLAVTPQAYRARFSA